MNITDISDQRIPQWFKSAVTKYNRWYFDTSKNLIIWTSGLWQRGDWLDGQWWYGTWQNGTWQNGLWKNGVWCKGIWLKGTWQNGTWQNGTWQDGYWLGGQWLGGIWQKGKIYDPQKVGNYQDSWQWSHCGTLVTSLINPKQYFKDLHVNRYMKTLKNSKKYMKMSDQQLVKLVGYESVQQWLDEWHQDQFNRVNFFKWHKDELNQSIYKLLRGK